LAGSLRHAARADRAWPRPKRPDYVYLTHGQVLALASEAGRWRLLILLLGAVDGKRPDDLIFSSPCPAAASCGYPTGGGPPSSRPVATQAFRFQM